VAPGDGEGILTLRLFAEWLRQDGEDIYLEYGQDDGGTWKLAYPRFVNRRILGSFECKAGKWMLAGMVDPWREEAQAGRKALLFVRVESDAVGSAE
jgi:hypothetical protein